MADVILINMWHNDIGRHDASNYGTFKVIFEANLQLFGADNTMKKLVFVLRDYKKKIKIESVMETLDRDLTEIWNEIRGKEQFKDSKYSQFFALEFIPMPSFDY